MKIRNKRFDRVNEGGKSVQEFAQKISDEGYEEEGIKLLGRCNFINSHLTNLGFEEVVKIKFYSSPYNFKTVWSDGLSYINILFYENTAEISTFKYHSNERIDYIANFSNLTFEEDV